MHKLIKTLRRATPWLPLLMLTLTSMSWSGCSTVKVISADQAETFVTAGVPFTPAVDGVFMPLARYQRYRRAGGGKNLEEEPKPERGIPKPRSRIPQPGGRTPVQRA